MIKDSLICLFSSLNILLFSFIGINYDAFRKVSQYQTNTTTIPSLDPLVWSLIHRFAPVVSSVSSEGQQTTPLSPPIAQSKSLYLSIPKLHILGPIYLSENPDTVQKNLEKGIVSLKPFMNPESPGQNILFGHSSDYPWKNNPFGTIFTLLPQLEKGDEILIKNGERFVRYQVRSLVITDPELTGLIGETSEHQLILSTCYPIGFFGKRYNVIATPSDSTPLVHS